ncbi:hypothetical protein [Glutamicibacter arilaitensis]|uniref:hypothetical protein n=1 Tax=Glutamicibacter arilaitensis TaxID=256701 RepID=UPI00384BE223
MTIQEILEAHLFVPGGFVDPGNHCSCGNYYNNEYFAGSIQLDEHLKHVAEVLEKHMQEERVVELERAADEVGAWGPACIPAAQSLRTLAKRIREATNGR